MAAPFNFEFTDDDGATIDVIRHASGNVTLGTYGGSYQGVIKLGPDKQLELAALLKGTE